MLKNTQRYLAECGDVEAKLEELESRIAALETEVPADSDAPAEEDRVFNLFDDEDGETCPECGDSPCSCEDDTDEEESEESEDEGVIDEEDVEEIEELDFDNPRFLSDDRYDDDEPEVDGGLYQYEDEDEEDGPYYR